MNFADRDVVVTGGTGALGIAVVGALLAAGATCHVAFRRESEAADFPHRQHARLRLVPVTNLADPDAADALYVAVPKLWASIHLAGGFAFGALTETQPGELKRQIEINLVSCLMCCRSAVVAMTKAGEGGRIVNVASRPGIEWRQGANMVAYTASKAGVAALTVALAEEVAAQNIWVNAVAPSIMDTRVNRDAMPKANTAAWPKTEEVAATILFLASPENRVTRGAVVPVYGQS